MTAYYTVTTWSRNFHASLRGHTLVRPPHSDGDRRLLRLYPPRPSRADRFAKGNRIQGADPDSRRIEIPFRSTLATKAFQSGQYTDALNRYLDAEHAAQVLSDRQNEALKNARLQIAQFYGNSGSPSEADGVYRAIIDGAIQQSQSFFLAKQCEQSLARAQDAEQFANLLNQNKLESLKPAIYASVNALKGLGRYPEAEQTEQRLIAYLNRTADDYDKAFSDEYMNLGYNRSEAQDWQGLRRGAGFGHRRCRPHPRSLLANPRPV